MTRDKETPSQRNRRIGRAAGYTVGVAANQRDAAIRERDAAKAEVDRLRGDRSPVPGLTECECCGQAFGALKRAEAALEVARAALTRPVDEEQARALEAVTAALASPGGSR